MGSIQLLLIEAHLVCSDDQLLNEDSGWGAYLEGRQRHGARSAAIPRAADPADLPSSYAESMTSPTQPSPQVNP